MHGGGAQGSQHGGGLQLAGLQQGAWKVWAQFCGGGHLGGQLKTGLGGGQHGGGHEVGGGQQGGGQQVGGQLLQCILAG